MKPIKFYENHYLIDNDGNVFCKRINKFLQPSRLKSGYMVLNLNDGSGPKTFYHHRLVAINLINNPCAYDFVNHKDKNRSNNSPDNLEWVTRQRNNEHGFSKHYIFVNPQGTNTEVFNLAKFCRENDLDNGAMVKVANGSRPHHKGWTRTCS